MAVTYSSSLKDTRMTDVKTAIDAGGAAGKLKIGTAAMGSVIVTITLAYTCGTVSAGRLTFSGTPLSGTASLAGTNTAAAAIITTSADVTVVSGLTVGTSGTNIVLDSTSITNGQTVTITSAYIDHG